MKFLLQWIIILHLEELFVLHINYNSSVPCLVDTFSLCHCMPHGSMQMPIGLNGLGMPTEGCSVCMPIVIISFKVRDVK